MMQKLIENATHLMLEYPKAGAKQNIKNCIKKVLGKDVPVRDYINWPNGICALGLVEYLENAERLENAEEAEKKTDETVEWSKDEDSSKCGCPGELGSNEGIKSSERGEEDNAINSIKASLGTFVDQWITSGRKIRSVEDYLSFYALHRYEVLKKGDESGEDIFSTAYEFLLSDTCRKNEHGSFIYNPRRPENYVLVDGIGMVCPFLTLYGIRYQNDTAVIMAITQLDEFMKYGIDKASGLPYHGFELVEHDSADSEMQKHEKTDLCVTKQNQAGMFASEQNLTSSEKLGLVGWGRAVGWLMMGLAGTLAHMKDTKWEQTEDYSRIRQYLCDLISVISEYQGEDGLFPWHFVTSVSREQAASGNSVATDMAQNTNSEVNCPVHSDTSATAMICYALAMAVQSGVFEDASKVSNILKTAKASLEKMVTAEGEVPGAQAESLGLGLHPDKFGSYPWSVGTTLAFLSISE